MDNTTTFLMEKGCPWVDLRESTGLPDVLWCERQLCEWITTPANTWTNLAYIVVAALFFAFLRKEKAENIRFFGVAALWVGVTSFAYHASIFFASQVIDFLGMYIFFFLLLVQNAARIGWGSDIKVKRNVWILSIITTLLSGTAAKLGMHLQVVVMLLIALILFTEFLAFKKKTKPYSFKYLAGALVFLGIGAAFSASDLTRRFCDPDNHWIQGHALWHCFNSVSLFLSAYHYRQFYSQDTGRLST